MMTLVRSVESRWMALTDLPLVATCSPPSARSGGCNVQLPARFWDKVEVRGIDDCWNWTAATNNIGYGRYRLSWGHVLSHRIAFLCETHIGSPLLVLHHCDNRPCVNRKHLYLGTHKDNSRDMVARNRSAAGERHPQSILSERDVVLIRAQYGSGKYTHSKIAGTFGIGRRTVSDIISGKTWRHLL